MKKSIPYFLFVLLQAFISGCVQEGSDNLPFGEVSFSAVTINNFEQGDPSLRLSEASPWRHIYKKSAEIIITHNKSGKEYTLFYDPSNFNQDYRIKLPFGEYSFKSEVEGMNHESYLPFKVKGEFSLYATSLDITLQASTNYGLITVKAEYVESADIGEDCKMQPTEDGQYFYLYIKEGLKPTLKIYETFNGSYFEKELEIHAHVHYHFFLKLTERKGQLNYIDLAIGEFDYVEEYFEIVDSVVYDASGNPYPVVKIGDQYWLAENLISTRFCNGEDIPIQPFPYLMEMYFDENIPVVAFSSINGYYSGYYNIHAATDQRNICPCGWHVSTDEDWKLLETYLGMPIDELDNLGMNRGAGQNVGGKLKATDWRNPFIPPIADYNNDATNESGFTAYPSEEMIFWDILDPDDLDSPGYWVVEGDNDGIWWALGKKNEPILTRTVNPYIGSSAEVTNSTGVDRNLFRVESHKLFPIRCVKD